MQSPGWAGWSSGICFLLPFMGASCEQQHGGRLSCSCSCSSSLSLIEQSGVYLEGYYGQSGALWRGSSRRHSQFELGKTPSPCPVPKCGNVQHSSTRWCCIPVWSYTEKGWGAPEKTKQTELEQLNSCSATSYFYLPHQHLYSHSKSALAAFAALPRAPGR